MRAGDPSGANFERNSTPFAARVAAPINAPWGTDPKLRVPRRSSRTRESQQWWLALIAAMTAAFTLAFTVWLRPGPVLVQISESTPAESATPSAPPPPATELMSHDSAPHKAQPQSSTSVQPSSRAPTKPHRAPTETRPAPAKPSEPRAGSTRPAIAPAAPALHADARSLTPKAPTPVTPAPALRPLGEGAAAPSPMAAPQPSNATPSGPIAAPNASTPPRATPVSEPASADRDSAQDRLDRLLTARPVLMIRPRQPAPPAAPPPSATGRVVMEELVVRGSLTSAAVRRAIERLEPSWRDCYRQHPGSDPQHPPGPTHIALQLDERGRARDPRVQGAGPVGLNSCLSQTFRKVVSLVPDTGTVNVSWTLRYTR